MFFNLNKKILLTIFAFFILNAVALIITFDNSINKKLRDQYSNLIARNQYVIELLHENITLRQKIDQLQPENINETNKTNLSEKQEELSQERKLSDELTKNYNEKYASLQENMQILIFNAILILCSLILLWFFLRRWVITPINKLILFSADVANGDFSHRLSPKIGKFSDEFDALMHTVNFMLSNIENNINEIKQKEIYLQNLIDAVPDAIRVIDKNHNIILSNKAYTEYIKNKYLYKSTKCYGAYQKEATCPCSSSQYVCPLQKLGETSASNIKIIHSINNRPLSINSARITLNKDYGIVESIRDLSDNISYSHQQKISSLGFLATSLAHEMKNNLGAINLILDGILQKYYNASPNENEEKNYLNMISNQIKECIKVPERLLKLSRNTENTFSTFNITAEISDILSLLDYEIKSKGINLIKHFSNTKEKITGNETDFKMIILNLVQNAINAMPNGGTLEIKTNAGKDSLYIFINDTGCGIPENELKHIFEPFYSTSDLTNKRGTGLGLAIVKDLLLKMNAEISVNSTQNVGSSFKITIPRKKMQKMLVK